uniref:Lysosomal amino acid transporter 1 homolog n=1 Tax=Malurus cyaneus samueli TaxID=2593467 RepID=A0A8C5X6U7_9PASS
SRAPVVVAVLLWLCLAARISHFYQACRTGTMDQALSLYFLLGWLGGDLLNLIGSFLADQLPLQAQTARDAPSFLPEMLPSPILGLLRFSSLGLFPSLPGMFRSLSPELSHSFPPRVFPFPTLLLPVPVPVPGPAFQPFSRTEIIGFTIGSISSVFYLCSRVPQICTNVSRKSTSGVSFSLFALVMLGNSLYGLSILLKNPEPGQGRGDYVLHHLPWLVGSLGVLALDVVISFQFLAYRKGRPGTLEERGALLGQQEESLES